jgi:hypothetical protein
MLIWKCRKQIVNDAWFGVYYMNETNEFVRKVAPYNYAKQDMNRTQPIGQLKQFM